MPRQNAQAKDSEWVRDREVLEKDKPADVNEILLSTPGMLLWLTLKVRHHKRCSQHSQTCVRFLEGQNCVSHSEGRI